MVHQSIHTSDDDAADISNVLSVKRSRQIQVCQRYLFQHANHTNQQLVDRGANGGLAGSDMRVIHKPHRKINTQGIDNHEVTGLDVVTAATLLNTSQGKVIGIFNEYAYLGKGSSIHSSGQLEWFKTNVDEKSVKVGGTQLITTLDGYSVPLLIKDGLAYATSLGKPTDQDMDTYPHVFFTSPDEWDPSVLDHDPPHLDGLDPSQVPDQPFGDPMFDAYGDFNERIIANLNILLDAPPEDCGSYTEISSVFTANLHQSSPQEPDWNALHPFFAWTSPSSIKDTFNVTTRHGTAPHTQDYIKKRFKSRNPVFNIQAEEIMSYNQLMDYIQKGTDAEEDPDSLFMFRDIVAHQGPLESTDPNHKGSKYNVMVEWESGEVTYEPLTLISKDDPITCAVYAKKHDLLDTTGWKHIKRYAKTSKRLIRAVKQSRIRQVRASARYQHGYQVPKDYNDAIRLDKENSNTHWQDAMDLELTQIHEYKVFKDIGKAQFHNGKVVTPDGFQKIRVHFVYAVKHGGRFKARLVADGHLTKEPVESIYSGVVSLRSLRMVVFLSQLNDLEIWGADVGNAYLEAYTDEKLCIIAGPEFKELQGPQPI